MVRRVALIACGLIFLAGGLAGVFVSTSPPSRFIDAVGVVTASADAQPGRSPEAVFAVRKGMTRRQVLLIAGTPYRRGGVYGRNCWFYRASKKGMSIDGKTFCFRGGLVSKVQTAVHG